MSLENPKSPSEIFYSHVQAIRPFVKNIIDNNEGIKLGEVYKKAEELKLGDFNTIRSAFLDIAATDGLSLDKDRRIQRPSSPK